MGEGNASAVINAIIAERDAEIVELKTDLYGYVLAVGERDAEIAALRAQVAELQAKVHEATSIAATYGQTDGDHHKLWVIDQMVRVLEGSNYEQFVRVACEGEDGPDTFSWDVGIAP